MKTPFGENSDLVQCKLLWRKLTYEADGWRRDRPAELPPLRWVVTDHVLNSIVEPINTERPRNRNALEEDKEQQTESRHSIRVENLEDIHSALQEYLFKTKIS